MLDYYTVLEIDETATISKIKKQFRLLAKKYHPDVNPDDENAASKFAKITEAYEVLSDEKARAKYDRDRKANPKYHSNRREQQHTQSETTSHEKYTESESVKVDFQNWDQQFEDFFAFNPKTSEVNKEKMKKSVNKRKVSREFEDFFGFSPKKK